MLTESFGARAVPAQSVDRQILKNLFFINHLTGGIGRRFF
jgi:hypothetical protein